MAKSGSTTVKVTDWNDLEFSWSLKSQSSASNTSTISWKLRLISTSSGRIDSSTNKTCIVTVNGKKHQGSTSISIGNNATKTLKSGTDTITHNDDGTKTFSYSFEQDFFITFDGVQIKTVSGSGSGTLDQIPKASQPSCVTWPEHTQIVGDFGTAIPIHMNRKSSSFKHTVRYQFGSLSDTIALNVENGTVWTIPMTLIDLIPNSVSGSGTIYVDTYDGSTFIGTRSCGFTATVPSYVKPSCSITVSDPTGYKNTYGSYVKGLSKFAVTINQTTSYSSPINSYSTTANGGKYTTETFTTGFLNSSGTLKVSATVKDSRGRSGSATASVNVLDYIAPVVSKLTVGRCDEDGTANESGSFVQATFSASVTALNNKNIATYKIRYKKSTATSFTENTISTIQNNYAVTNHKYIFAADTDSSYDVEVYVADNHATATRATSASTAFTLMHFRADGTGIGLLKVSEKPNVVDVGGDIHMNGHAVYGAHGLYDTRADNQTPEWYMTNYGSGTVWEFKTMTAIGFTSPSATYAPVQTIIPWKDSSGGMPRQVAYEGATRWTRIASSLTVWGAWKSDALIAYPVGSIYIAYNHTDPGTLFGGTWERISNSFLWGVDSSGTIGQTGGEKTVKLTGDNLPSHTHSIAVASTESGTKTASNMIRFNNNASSYVGSLLSSVNSTKNEAHNNMPPYIQVSIWRRTA